MTTIERRMFIDQQASQDLAVGVLYESHSWEDMLAAVQRAADFLGLDLPNLRLPAVRVPGVGVSLGGWAQAVRR